MAEYSKITSKVWIRKENKIKIFGFEPILSFPDIWSIFIIIKNMSGHQFIFFEGENEENIIGVFPSDLDLHLNF